MTTIPLPTPKEAAPPRAWGLNDHDAEARRRVVLAILPYQRDPDGVIDLADYIINGPDEEDDDA